MYSQKESASLFLLNLHNFCGNRKAHRVLVTRLWVSLTRFSQKRSRRWLLPHRTLALSYSVWAYLAVPAKAVAGPSALVEAGIAFLHSYLHVSHQLAKVAGLLRVVFLGGK